MSYITATEIDLLTFFEVEPAMNDTNVPWVYNDYTYSITRPDSSILFGIHPASKDVRITITNQGETVYELQAASIVNVTYHSEHNGESLHLQLNDHDELWLSVKPHITLRQACDNRA